MVPLTIVILVALFAVQSRGTAKVAAFFGPITVVWFLAIAVAGLFQVGANPLSCWRSTRPMASNSWRATARSA